MDQLRRQLRAGNTRKALALAATFQDLGEYDVAVRRAHQARIHPVFLTRLGPSRGKPIARRASRSSATQSPFAFKRHAESFCVQAPRRLASP